MVGHESVQVSPGRRGQCFYYAGLGGRAARDRGRWRIDVCDDPCRQHEPAHARQQLDALVGGLKRGSLRMTILLVIILLVLLLGGGGGYYGYGRWGVGGGAGIGLGTILLILLIAYLLGFFPHRY